MTLGLVRPILRSTKGSLGNPMIPRRIFALLLLVLSAGSIVAADKGDQPKRLSDDDRKAIIRSLMAENFFAHRYFPMGKVGLRIENGQVTPSDPEVRQLVADNGPAVKPGDRGRITDVRFLKNGIVFEVNGGPVKKKKWYDRLSVGVNGNESTGSGKAPTDDELYTNARGSYVMLAFKEYVPSLTPDQVRQMLAPVLDFKASSVAEAYQKSLPPVLADAVKNHKALVGMDREMVTYAKGRPPRRHRERDGESEYEEWIYGQPPAEVEFIRFVGDKVVRIETMKIDGEKVIRTQNEVGDLSGVMAASAQKQDQPADQSSGGKGPSLMRPGEQTVKADPAARAKMPPPGGGTSSAPGTSPTGPGSLPDASQGGSGGIPGQGPR